VGIPSVVGDHVDVRVGAPVLRIARADFEYLRGPARFIDQMVAIGITTPERGAVADAQCFFAGVRDEGQLTLEHPDEFVFMSVPVTLAGPSPRLDDRHVHAELSQPRETRNSFGELSFAGFIEGTWIGAARFRGHNGKIDLLHDTEHLRLRVTVLTIQHLGDAMLIHRAF
jgi:hypothetical protein